MRRSLPADRARSGLLVLLLSVAGATGCDAPPPKVIGGGPGFVAAESGASPGAAGSRTSPAEPPAAAPDPRVTCPTGTMQHVEHTQFAPRRFEIWCEDEDGYKHGPEKSFWENGKPASETAYVRGQEDGPDRTWYQSGQLESEGAHQTGVTVGRSRHWHENGKLQHEARWVSDEAVGIGRWWDERGRLERTRNYDEPPTPKEDEPTTLEQAERDGTGRFRFRTGMESWSVRSDGAASNRYVGNFEADHRFEVGGEVEEIWASDLGPMHGGNTLVAAVWSAAGGARSTTLERVHSFTLVTRWKAMHPFAIRAPVVLGHHLYASGDGHVVKIDTATGAVVWRKPAPGIALGPPRIETRKVVYPVVVHGALPAGFPTEVAVDERTGRVLTRLPR